MQGWIASKNLKIKAAKMAAPRPLYESTKIEGADRMIAEFLAKREAARDVRQLLRARL